MTVRFPRRRLRTYRIAALALAVSAALIMAACGASGTGTVFDRIRESPAARLELPDGSAVIADGEIAALRSFADLQLREAPAEPADSGDDWLYRIVFNPAEKVKNAEEIVVSFHKDCVQIDSEYYLPRDGVPYESILEWAESKFEHFMAE